MRIQIDGIGLINKGAELMFYAVLQEIERKYPDSEIIINNSNEDFSAVKTNLKLKKRKHSNIIRLLNKYRISSILRRLHLQSTFLTPKYPINNIDILFDASGFQFSDQWNHTSKQIKLLENYLNKLKQNGTKIIYLSQAFGPFEKDNSKEIVRVLDIYADCLIARENVSYNYLKDCNVNKEKLFSFTDFTPLVNGIFPKNYESLKGGVAIIPNMKMIVKTSISKDVYIAFMLDIIKECKKKGKNSFLLNHEGKGDLDLCKLINSNLEEEIQIIDGLNALEVKGIIEKSYLVISSRFHGVANALNGGVPCLATSWSHKYELLFNDFGLNDFVLDINKGSLGFEKLHLLLDDDYNKEIRETLKEKKIEITDEVKDMWKTVWQIINQNNISNK